MLKPPTFLITKPLNYLIARAGWANDRLKLFADKSITFNIFPWAYHLKINTDGLWEKALSDMQPNAVFTFTPFAGLRFMQGDKKVQNTIQVEGDMQFAKEVAYVFQNLSWDYEEDLSKIFGDVVAHRIANIIGDISSWAKQASNNLTENIRDYWVQEKPMIMSTQTINHFNKEVDVLRDDVERLEKRLQKLAR